MQFYLRMRQRQVWKIRISANWCRSSDGGYCALARSQRTVQQLRLSTCSHCDGDAGGRLRCAGMVWKDWSGKVGRRLSGVCYCMSGRAVSRYLTTNIPVHQHDVMPSAGTCAIVVIREPACAQRPAMVRRLVSDALGCGGRCLVFADFG